MPTDSADDMVIATALAANAELIVTGDSDLLALHPLRGTQIFNASNTLENLRRKTND